MVSRGGIRERMIETSRLTKKNTEHYADKMRRSDKRTEGNKERLLMEPRGDPGELISSFLTRMNTHKQWARTAFSADLVLNGALRTQTKWAKRWDCARAESFLSLELRKSEGFYLELEVLQKKAPKSSVVTWNVNVMNQVSVTMTANLIL